MVHGLWSSPMTWMEMFNDLRSLSQIREHYQFWFYLYPTDQPFWLSAAQLRHDLIQAREVLDPKRQEPALDAMVLIGHSMGGLVARLQTLNSGDDFWRLVSSQPLSQIKTDPEVRRKLQETFFFQPNPSIRRVVTISTPYRGSTFSNQATQWLIDELIRMPSKALNSQQKLYRDNSDAISESSLLRVETSVDSLAPSSPIFATMLASKHPPWVRYHNIVGVVPKQWWLAKLTSEGDGWVGRDSARRRRPLRGRRSGRSHDHPDASRGGPRGAAHPLGTPGRIDRPPGRKPRPTSRSRWVLIQSGRALIPCAAADSLAPISSGRHAVTRRRRLLGMDVIRVHAHPTPCVVKSMPPNQRGQSRERQLRLDHGAGRVDAAERGADLNPGHPIAEPRHGLAGDLHAHGELPFAAFDRRHPLHHRVGHDHARDFIPHEQGVAVTGQRPDAGENRNAVLLDVVEEAQQGVGIEDRLRDREFGAGFDFLPEAVELAPAIDGSGIQARRR